MEIGKFYADGAGNRFKCLRVLEGNAYLWLLIEPPARNAEAEGDPGMLLPFSGVVAQDLRFAAELSEVEDTREIARLEELFRGQDRRRPRGRLSPTAP